MRSQIFQKLQKNLENDQGCSLQTHKTAKCGFLQGELQNEQDQQQKAALRRVREIRQRGRHQAGL